MKSIVVQLVVAALVLGLGAPAGASNDEEEAARAEYEKALTLEPNLENGRRAYLTCAVCHRPEGWGQEDGSYPQVAGQLRNVLIKQLADIRARNRDNPIMYPFAVPRILGNAQEIVDVAAYISQLPMTPFNSVGPGVDLALGRKLYEENCVECHGKQGEGNEKDHIPLIAGQHYRYLVRQFEWIRLGKRRNADEKMVKQVQGFSPRDVHAVMDYVSRLPPDKAKVASPGWVNPDFPQFVRPPAPPPPPPRI